MLFPPHNMKMLPFSLVILMMGISSNSYLSVGNELTFARKAEVEADWIRQDAKRLLPVSSGVLPTKEQDASGGVDGIKDGKWGFHTQFESNPWWQVDLGKPIALSSITLYNRCDQFANRNDRIKISTSSDGITYHQVYQHRD